MLRRCCGDARSASPFPMLAQLRSFLVVIEESTLRRAAVRLHISQPALSRQMQALEDEVGGRLLERTSSGVLLPDRSGTCLGCEDSTDP